jgi:hypothetical protein
MMYRHPQSQVLARVDLPDPAGPMSTMTTGSGMVIATRACDLGNEGDTAFCTALLTSRKVGDTVSEIACLRAKD